MYVILNFVHKFLINQLITFLLLWRNLFRDEKYLKS